MTVHPPDDPRRPIGDEWRGGRNPKRSGSYGAIALGSLGCLCGEAILGGQLWFAPGWANDWFGGRVSIFDVWSTGMATVVFMLQVTAVVGLGALLGLVLDRFEGTRRHAGLAFWACLLAGATLALVTFPAFRQSAYDSAVAMWPDGYNPH